ncbi:GGDEF domain-containing protein, partial [Mesorhizobium sp. M3A.F.Ca.ET.201.01.1.1]
MGSADFILVINLFVAGLLAAAFMTIAIHDVGRVSARWMAFAYGLGMAYFAMEFS